MSYLEKKQVVACLARIREIGLSQKITDMHVHATEVIRARHRYNGDAADLMSRANAATYKCAEVGRLRLSMPDAALRMDEASRNRLSELMFERAFDHTGVRVMHDQMDLCSVSRVVLLPVASAVAPVGDQMKVLTTMRDASRRILIGYAVSPDVATAKIDEHLQIAARQFDPSAIKLHPNLSGIDLTGQSGRDRVEAILEASGRLGLPVIVHGGCSPILGRDPAAKFAQISSLANIDWSVSSAAVVIAHFGVYGCSGSQLQHSGFADVMRLLERHPNLYLDTSGVGPELISAAVRQTDLDRLIFGSDALYLPIWHVLVGLYHALCEMGHKQPGDALTRIAVLNSDKILPQ